MVRNIEKVTYIDDNNKDVEIPIDTESRVEMELSRETASTGKWPTMHRINALRKEYNLPPLKATVPRVKRKIDKRKRRD